MKTLLHILTQGEDALARCVIEAQQGCADQEVLVMDLSGPAPDYDGLVERLFEAESIAVW